MYNETWVPLWKGGVIRWEEMVLAHPPVNPFPAWSRFAGAAVGWVSFRVPHHLSQLSRSSSWP